MSTVTVKFLGTGDAFGSGGKMYTCFLVQSSGLFFLIDCGATALISIKKYSLKTNMIDLIIISHFHGDHFGGLPFFLLQAAKIEQRKKPLTIVSPQGCREKLETLMETLYPGTSKLIDQLNVNFISYESGKETALQNFELTPFPVVHSKPSQPHGLRIKTNDKIIAYSGDTEWTDELFKVADGADLFICECNFYEREVEGHLNYRELMKHKDNFNCKNLVLTHLGEEMLENASQSKIKIAEEGMSVEV